MAVTNVPIEKIRPNPYQPSSRIKPPEEEAAIYGNSILQHGMISTPVCRRTDGFFEMGDGWLRLQGHKWLVDHGHVEFQVIRIDIRELTDQQMADLVLEANKTRKDLSDIDQAEFYQRYIKDFGISQAELAKRFNRSQGEIANTLRLLELPKSIQEKVISQEITGTHARQLLRLNPLPAMQEEFAQATIEHGMSVTQLDNEMNLKLHRNSKPLSPGQWDSAKFDTKECEKCTFRMLIADPYGTRKKEPRCTKLECWENKQKEAEKAQEEATRKKLQKKAGAKEILTSKDIPYGKYESLDNYKKELENPSQCDDCDKRRLFKYDVDQSREAFPICLDKKCHSTKKGKRTRDENKRKKDLDKELTARIGEICRKVNKNRYGALVMATRHAIDSMPAAARDDVMSMFQDMDLPKHSNGRMRPEVLAGLLNGMAEPQMIQLFVAASISRVRRNESSSEKYSTKLNDSLLLEVSILDGTYEVKAAETITFQEANCAECNHVIPELVKTGECCCDDARWNRKVKDGVCQNSPKFKSDKATEKESAAAGVKQ